MIELSGEEKNRQKNFIIERSSFLPIFIDDYAEKDPDMWLKMLANSIRSRKEEIIGPVGEDVINKDIDTYFSVAEEFEVFNAGIGEETKVTLIFCFAWIGFEIGDKNKLILFKDDVLKQAHLLDVMNENKDTDEFVKQVLECGVTWKEEIKYDVPEEFSDFINDLDF